MQSEQVKVDSQRIEEGEEIVYISQVPPKTDWSSLIEKAIPLTLHYKTILPFLVHKFSTEFWNWEILALVDTIEIKDDKIAFHIASKEKRIEVIQCCFPVVMKQRVLSEGKMKLPLIPFEVLSKEIHEIKKNLDEMDVCSALALVEGADGSEDHWRLSMPSSNIENAVDYFCKMFSSCIEFMINE